MRRGWKVVEGEWELICNFYQEVDIEHLSFVKTRNTCEDRKVFILNLQLRRHGYCVTIIQIGTKEGPVPRFCLIWSKLSPSSSIALPSRRFSFIATSIRIIWGTKGIRCELGAPVPGIYHLWMVNRQHQGTGSLLLLESTLKSQEKNWLWWSWVWFVAKWASQWNYFATSCFPRGHTKLYIFELNSEQ